MFLGAGAEAEKGEKCGYIKESSLLCSTELVTDEEKERKRGVLQRIFSLPPLASGAMGPRKEKKEKLMRKCLFSVPRAGNRKLQEREKRRVLGKFLFSTPCAGGHEPQEGEKREVFKEPSPCPPIEVAAGFRKMLQKPKIYVRMSPWLAETAYGHTRCVHYFKRSEGYAFTSGGR